MTNWLMVGEWAEEMGDKLEQQRQERLQLAAKHFNLNLDDITDDRAAENQLLARYEEAGLAWPSSVHENMRYKE